MFNRRGSRMEPWGLSYLFAQMCVHKKVPVSSRQSYMLCHDMMLRKCSALCKQRSNTVYLTMSHFDK